MNNGKKTTAWERVKRRTVITPGCWRCSLAHTDQGYARVRDDDGVTRGAHIVSYVHHFGPVPDGMCVDHVAARGCVWRDCVNPDHLEAVTWAENVRRSNAPGQVTQRTGVCRKGHSMEDALINSDGSRRCRPCRRASSKTYGKNRSRKQVPHGDV